MILNIILIIAILILVFLLFWKFYFLRNPDRITPEGNNVVSPADGKVVRVLKINNDKIIEKGLLGKVKIVSEDVFKKGYLIAIMMTPLDVHYQRVPIDGEVIRKKYKSGNFHNVVRGAKSIRIFDNERNEILMKTKIGRVKVVQIAGALARRISDFVKTNQNIKKGELLGLINLGSMVCLLLPEKVNLRVKEDEKVKAGETIIAEY
ncbi:phosphatidylserine decarboxylase family protein [Candidatus Woesearchaeota archaeon]|jgi:phosphatidylserine decarboxylase|nr:phosphatidylserine decarboxylase family protein [Candidatus Woesearchaeota archaeon]MBT3538017.1 phosphatidylserine decarboxylase family protein [Candidatus Woesearchaeota archaeon]MBT4698108.1 phosphatidylserine decarboxylase family protein [Candidatus Woesearchaeota archaeon]MBT4717092.1 phosphatidylserine decarboxylase family protein [Candidatus Woesearchaeota archaeon]MBT7105686.1 phosphatidylserine decarboxylase family protein [Candidatus Woesearchaeota archaeon]